MASFSDLEFGPHPEVEGGIIARKEFDNGYGIVVERYYITDERGAILNYTLGSENGLYQIGFTKGGEPFFEDPMPSDYIGAASEEVVTEIIEMVESAKITVSMTDEDDEEIDIQTEENSDVLDYRHDESFVRGNYSIGPIEM
jgi:HSP20 family molecular chaperone IbpA